MLALMRPLCLDPSGGGGAARMLLLGLLFLAIGVVCDGLEAWFSGGLSELLARRPRFSPAAQWLASGFLVALASSAPSPSDGSPSAPAGRATARTREPRMARDLPPLIPPKGGWGRRDADL